MIDPFVLLAPVLLLAVIALLRFIGCDRVFGLETVTYPKPTILSFDPPSAAVGDPDFELTVTGSDFFTGLTVTFGSTALMPGSVTNTEIKVTVPATAPELASPGQITVTVTNPDPSQGPAIALYTINPSDINVTFSPDPTPPPAGPLNVPYKNLNFDAQWWWERSTAENNLNHIYLAPGQGQASFTFANGPRLLKSLKVSANPAGNITVSDPDHPQNMMIGPLFIPVTTGISVLVPIIGWTQKSTTVTVSFDQVNSIGIDTITYQGPA